MTTNIDRTSAASRRAPGEGSRGRRRAIAAAVIGNLLEWYDFAIYGYLATIVAHVFFPPGDEMAALLATFATFGIGFVVRPLGGVLIGRLADTRGRKAALTLTMFLMAAGTVLIGLLPTYAQIGMLAPLALVVARLVQGFAAGGEWGGSTAFIVEWAPARRRGLYGSLQQSSVAAGLLLGSGTAALCSTLLTPEAMESWGWRVPFLLGGLLAPVGVYIRRNIDETPAFEAAREANASDPAGTEPPVLLAARALGFAVIWTVAYYIMLSYMPTFTQKYAGLSRSEALWSNTVGLVVLVCAVPLFGWLSDRVGRKPLLLACCLSFAVLCYPLFGLMLSHPSWGLVVAIQVLFAIMIATFSGPGPAAIAEIFPTRLRSTWMSAGYSLAVALFGGFAPFIATWLIARSGSPIAPTWYVIAAALVSMVVIVRLRETAHAPLS